MLKTVQQTLSCATEMLFVRLWRGPAAASAFPDTLEMEKYALVIIIQGRIQHFCWESGCTRRIPVVLENRRSSQRGGGGVRTPYTLPLDPPLL